MGIQKATRNIDPLPQEPVSETVVGHLAGNVPTKKRHTDGGLSFIDHRNMVTFDIDGYLV